MFLVIKNGGRVVRREDTAVRARLWVMNELDKPVNSEVTFEVCRVVKKIYNEKIVTETTQRVEEDS